MFDTQEIFTYKFAIVISHLFTPTTIEAAKPKWLGFE
jgi:hypothetical protein